MFGITIDNTVNTRLAGIYSTQEKAESVCNAKNSQAEQMGIKTRYKVSPADASWLNERETVKE